MTIAENDRQSKAQNAEMSGAEDFKQVRADLIAEGETTGAILEDKTTTGRDRGWKDKKKMALRIGKVYKRLSDRYVSKQKVYKSRAEYLKDCASALIFKECPSGHEKHLFGAFFCRLRLCPICSWRRGKKQGHQAKAVLHHLVELYPNQEFLFLTLTVKNCKGADLKTEIDRLLKSWKKMSERKFFKKAVRGWFRALEVTYNSKREDFHPHIHIVLAVNPSYFKADYVKQAQWVDEWRSALQVDYDPVVDIRKAGEKKKDETLTPKERAELVAEASKYTVKATDILIGNENTQEYVLHILDNALARRKLVAYGGELLEIFKKLKYDPVDETTDLINIEEDEKTKRCKCKTCGSDFINVLYSWCEGVDEYLAKEMPVSLHQIDK